MLNKINKTQNIWNRSYKNNKQFSKWPWSDLISSCSKFCKLNSKSHVLEIGCGVGANVPFFESTGCNYTGVDISQKAIEYLKNKNKNKKLKFINNDYLLLKSIKKFDLIVDRAAITCGNDRDKIHKIINKINHDLNQTGKFVGIDWYSKNTQSYKNVGKEESFITPSKGPLSNIGKLYFSNLSDIKKTLKIFNIISLNEKKVKNFLDKNYSLATWSFVCEKKI